MLLKGIILIVIAFYIIYNPVEALVAMAFYIGISLLLTGALTFIAAISLRKIKDNWGWSMAEGILDIIFAVILLSNPGLTAATIPFIVGFWVIVYGIFVLVNSFQARKNGKAEWWVGVLLGLLTILMGYIITSNILAGTMAITFWIGSGVLISGITSIMIAFRLKKIKTES